LAIWRGGRDRGGPARRRRAPARGPRTLDATRASRCADARLRYGGGISATDAQYDPGAGVAESAASRRAAMRNGERRGRCRASGGAARIRRGPGGRARPRWRKTASRL
jgi:hypothetical protein